MEETRPCVSSAPRVAPDGQLDLTNNKLWFLDRKSGKLLGSMGQMGEQGGQWFGFHMIAVDTRDNVYTGEVFAGERVQRFVPAESARGKILEQLSRTQ